MHIPNVFSSTRRRIFLHLLAFLGFIYLGIGKGTAQVTGTVYLDLNENSRRDRSEKGLADVAVSNGAEVVLTDAYGKYRLPISQDAIVFAVKPSGYRFTRGKSGESQFYYIHKPSGSPESRYEGVNPTGKLPEHIDFGLVAQQEEGPYSALIFGDPQPRNLEELGYFEKSIVNDISPDTDFAFGISLGDLVWNNLNLFRPYKKAMSKLKIRWYDVIGNHDLNARAQEDRFSDETFEAHFGPATYSFNYGRTHVIILDDILYPDPRDSKGYWGGFTTEQLQFLENDLQYVPKDYLIVLAFHIPLSEPDGDTFRDQDRKRLFELLRDFPHTLSLSAHTHLQRQDFFGPEEGWEGKGIHHHFNVGTTSGDWNSGIQVEGIPVAQMRDGTPRGYAILNVDGSGYSIDYKVADKPEDYQIRLFLPRVMAQGVYSKAGLYANFFMGSEKDEVRYRIDEGPWKPMEYILDYDPVYANSVYDWDLSDTLIRGRRPSNPDFSRHLWYVRLPTDLPAGVHEVEVKATDMFGQVHSARGQYRLE